VTTTKGLFKGEHMTAFFRTVTAAGLLALAFDSAALAQFAPDRSVPVPPVPPNLQVPAGNLAFLKGEAAGTQNYICLPSATGFSWTFFSPQATLFLTLKSFNGGIRQQIITHFLSPNPIEKGTPRATWQGSFDSSAVWARAIQSSTDPTFVADGAIPWLLLQSVGTQRGPTGGELLSDTTFIHRVNTAGGLAPTEGCSEAKDIGATRLVPYTADYFFYKGGPK
jgi:hypothetical protein